MFGGFSSEKNVLEVGGKKAGENIKLYTNYLRQWGSSSEIKYRL